MIITILITNSNGKFSSIKYLENFVPIIFMITIYNDNIIINYKYLLFNLFIYLSLLIFI